MHLLSTLVGVALPQMADAMGIIRIRQAMRQIPRSLVEAARLDKVPHFITMTRIVIDSVTSCFLILTSLIIHTGSRAKESFHLLSCKDNHSKANNKLF